MTVKFTTQEMFVIYVLMESAKLLSHKIALKKLVNDFLSDNSFCRAIELKDLTDKNLEKAKQDHKAEVDAYVKELKVFRGKPADQIPAELKQRDQDIKTAIIENAAKKNKKLIAEFNELMKSKAEFEVEVGDLAKKALMQIGVDDDVKVVDLNMSKDAIESFVNVCVKLGIG